MFILVTIVGKSGASKFCIDQSELKDFEPLEVGKDLPCVMTDGKVINAKIVEVHKGRVIYGPQMDKKSL